MNWLKRLFSKHDERFPKTVRDHWYCGSWYLYLSGLIDEGKYKQNTLDPEDFSVTALDKVAFNHHRMGIHNGDVSGLMDGLIPAIQVGTKVGLYRQIGNTHRPSSFYDGASWDDGYKIDLEFVKAVEAQLQETGE